MDELHWLYPDLHSGLIWDCSMGEDARRVLVGGEAGGGAGDSEPDASSSAVVRELVQRAQKGPLLPAQQQQVLVALEAHPRLALSLLPGGSAQLPQLVEHCPAIAAELLIRLLQRREPPPAAAAVPASASVLPPLIDEMLATLARSEISLHGMEVVNRLASVDLPHDFVHAYIVNCLRSCEGTQVRSWEGGSLRSMRGCRWAAQDGPCSISASTSSLPRLSPLPLRINMCRADWSASCVSSCTASSVAEWWPQQTCCMSFR